MESLTAAGPRREWNKRQTRFDLAMAAFELARRHGLGAVRVPQIAEAVGVSTRTFNNYFSSREQAIAWLAGRRAAAVGDALRDRPDGEPLDRALTAAALTQYRPAAQDGLPAGWLRDFRDLVAREPALHGAYLTAMADAERDLATAIAERVPDGGQLFSQVVASMVFGAERAGVRYWSEHRDGTLVDAVRQALAVGLAGIGGVR
ncbi:TetR/AcrR family transcriptional regulator [Streptantibioticus silvisoli]|uniref:TetR/AcrR family transcriptional regulator n=1 Tax=Streptantibioticus silvisoli TaxID=2705255 RepID=A0ABT6W188_9ACTN|nr:TetR/AcrR family transcriptional regulator [Streptantibioticus silvisoli]MDI5964516.1 TetR/AcrR family transcriptional regulator [Streptantibioticus silvisoli]